MAEFEPDLMSYFPAPITPFCDGRSFHPASVLPTKTLFLAEVAMMIRDDPDLERRTERVRRAESCRTAKGELLPYVTPMGVFSRRNARSIMSVSGLAVIDFDKAEGDFDIEEVKRRVFDMFPHLVRLAFTSPSGRGLKFFVDLGGDVTALNPRMWENMFHGLNAWLAQDFPGLFTLDEAGKDVCRACFLCHDPNVLFRSDDE